MTLSTAVTLSSLGGADPDARALRAAAAPATGTARRRFPWVQPRAGRHAHALHPDRERVQPPSVAGAAGHRRRGGGGGIQLYVDAKGLPCPREDQGYFFASVQLPEAASLERTEAVMTTARELIAKNPAVEDVIQVSGFNILNGTSASNGGFISIMLKDWGERPPLDEVMGTLQRQLLALPEATIMTFAPPTLPGLGNASGFDLRIQAQAGQKPGGAGARDA